MGKELQEWSLGAVGMWLPAAPDEDKKADKADLLHERVALSWKRICHYMTKEGDCIDHNGILSLQQTIAFEMLFEWWLDLSPEKRRGSQEATFDHGIVEGEGYQASMQRLFKREFWNETYYSPDTESPDASFVRGQDRRNTALNAYCQHWGRRAFDICRSEEGEYVDDRDISAPLEWLYTVGPIIEPCPWLEESVDEWHDWPYYLWSVSERRTIQTSSLDSLPDYVAVSHTWGRWSSGDLITLPGVPWKIPGNTLFLVEHLPDILMRIPDITNCKYVWLDLLCIPQDRSPLGVQEISRQAKIFQSAERAVAWLNEVDNLHGLQQIVKWQALFFFDSSHRTVEDIQAHQRFCTDAYTDLANLRCELVAADSKDPTSQQPIPWFTSLWTLQELCLRPDMWLCSRDWTPLTISDTSSHPIPFSGLIALQELCRNKDVDIYDDVSCLDQIANWEETTGLSELLWLDRVAILQLGERRSCTGRRAEAIMSALGTTTWYKNGFASGKYLAGDLSTLESELVLGRYPLSFVQELADAIPGFLFSTLLKEEIHDNDDNDNCSQLSLRNFHGSMLPFGRERAFYWAPSPVHRESHWAVLPHSSLYSWKVNLDGSVRISQACILSPSTPATDSTFSGKIFLKGTLSQAQPRERDEIDLHAWTAARPSETFLIITQVQDGWPLACYGVILQRMTDDRFVMIGTFSHHDNSDEDVSVVLHHDDDILKAVEVDWVVI